jgi:hypothetical protein
MKSISANEPPSQLPPRMAVTLCLPCVSSWHDEETGIASYVAEVRYQGSVPAPALLDSPEGRQRHEHEDDAFHELAAEVRGLPALIQWFEIVVGERTFVDAELAARAIEAERPLCQRPAKVSPWLRLLSSPSRAKREQ